MRINLNDKLFEEIKAQANKHDSINTIQLIERILSSFMEGLKEAEKINIPKE